MVLYLWIVLQIILESLPVSSSGHVALMQKYMNSFGDLSTCQDSLWIIDFLLHGPMIVILFLFFFKTWWQMIFGKSFSLRMLKQLVTFQSSFDTKSQGDFTQDERRENKKMDPRSSLGRGKESSSWARIIQVMIFGLIADGITIFCWWLDVMPTISLTAGFMITAILLYATRYCKETSHTFDADFVYAILLGIGQSISFLPGISRFATTYAVGRFCGYSGRISFAVSFLIQFPLLIAAFGKGIASVRKYPELMRNIFDFKVLFVILTASIVSYVLLWCVDSIIKKNKLWRFSWYMLIPIMLTLFV